MLDLEAVARQWIPGRATPVVRLVARGPGHATYQVRRGRQRYALRLPDAAAGGAGADLWFARVAAATAAAGLAPPVIAADPASGLVVTAWVAGRCWTRAYARADATLPRIATLIRAIQAVVPGGELPVRGPSHWIETYAAGQREGLATTPGLQVMAQQYLAMLAALPPPAPVLCHSDLHRLNLVEGPAGLRVLDWEYAHVADGYWDLAGWLSANDLGTGSAQLLLASYLQRPPERPEQLRLALLRWLFDYVCLLWSETHATTGKRAAQLARRLAAMPVVYP